MNKLDPVIQKDKITILITAIVFFISLFILTLIIIPSARYSFWNGYHLLLLEKRENNSDISGLLKMLKDLTELYQNIIPLWNSPTTIHLKRFFSLILKGDSIRKIPDLILL